MSKRDKRLGEPGAIGMVVLNQRPVNVVPSPKEPPMPTHPCACPQGLTLTSCEYHQEVAQRFLETLNTTTRPAANVTRTYSRGGYVHQENA